MATPSSRRRARRQLPKIAVINSSPSVIDMLRSFLESEGYETVTAHVDNIKSGQVDLVEFLKTHKPGVVIYDLSPPYDENWTFLKLIRDTHAAGETKFVLTTTNKERLEQAAGQPTGSIELVGKPFDLEQILKAVQTAAGSQ